MDRYHVYNWTLHDYILIDRVTLELRYFCTNYENMMGEYHGNNPSVSKLSKHKISGLIRRINNGLSLENSFVIDKFIYHLIMSDEQRKKCNVTDFLLKYELNIEKAEFITSGNDYDTVLNSMKEIVNNKAIEAKKLKLLS